MTRVAILDRDATIIDVVRDEETGTVSVAFHPEQLRFLPGAIEGMRTLQDSGYVLCIATNQPGPAKGQFSVEAVRRTNRALTERLTHEGVRIAAIEVCMHHPGGGPGGDPLLLQSCECRKPKPGMLNALVQRLGAVRADSWMIGDSASDIEAGHAAGLRTGLLFLPNRCELCPMRSAAAGPVPDARGATLLELAGIIVRGA
ncbi:MAG TPA: HAD-IIIA family hydrolase [Polyangiaceae bacterium]|nr:HAD-IIIA family hydrolase [Polyangiaceae bacterium]